LPRTGGAPLRLLSISFAAGTFAGSALAGLHLSDVDVEVADRVGGKALLLRLVALDLGEPTDAVALKAAVKR
jgi:hypothetical protein